MLSNCNWKLAVVLAASLSNLGAAQTDNTSPIVDFDAKQFNDALEDPDAKGESSLSDSSGFDLTKPWPGTAVAGWKARVEIKADVPVGDDGYTTVTRFSYQPPNGVEVKTNDTGDFTAADESWLPCSNLWYSMKLTSSSKDVDGACSGILPNECIQDLTRTLRVGFDGNYKYDDKFNSPHCPITRFPVSCEAALGNDTRLISFEPNTTIPLDFMNLNPWYWYEEQDVHKKGDDAIYKAALNRVWVVGTAWGYSKYSKFANGSDPNINATITCLRANGGQTDEKKDDGDEKAENGDDKANKGDDGSGAARLGQTLGTTAGLAVAVVAMLSFL